MSGADKVIGLLDKAKFVERYKGKWVVFSGSKVVGASKVGGKSLARIVAKARKLNSKYAPYIHFVCDPENKTPEDFSVEFE